MAAQGFGIIGAYYGNYFFWVNILVIVLSGVRSPPGGQDVWHGCGALFALRLCVAHGAYDGFCHPARASAVTQEMPRRQREPPPIIRS
jgi:hypothetical protein